MESYATIADVVEGFRELTESEQRVCERLLEEADVIIDTYNRHASDDAKRVVASRMVRRAIGEDASSVTFPIGATQGSVSALGYSQSWSNGNGSSGELYLSKLEKKMLGVGGSVTFLSPLEV